MINIYGIYYVDKLIYVGQTNKKIEYRFADHKAAAKNRPNTCPKLYAKFNKHGIENFSIKLLAIAKNGQLADNKEIQLIAENGLLINGCNIAIGGKVNRGMVKTPAQREQCKQRSLFNYYQKQIGLAKWNGSKQQKELLSKTHSNKHVSDDTKQRITLAKSNGPYIITKNNQLFETFSINKFAKQHGLNATSLRCSLWNNRIVKSKGYYISVNVKNMVG